MIEVQGMKCDPAWYDIGTNKNGTALIIETHPQVANNVKNTLEEKIPVKPTRIEMSDWVSPVNEKWGFGGAIKTSIDQTAKWTKWKIDLPKGFKLSVDDPYYMEGSWETELNWPGLYNVSLSIEKLLKVVNLHKMETNSQKPQLLTINSATQMGTGNIPAFPLWGQVEPGFNVWLNRLASPQKEQDLEEAGQVVTETSKKMLNAYSRMWGKRESYFQTCFKTLFSEPKYLDLICLGNACDLSHDMYKVTDDLAGYDISTHNCDGPLQQLTLLIGLASLHDQARKAGY